MIEAILFDLDGTIIDSNEMIFQTFEKVFAEHLHQPITRDEIVTTFGRPLNEVFDEYMPGQGEALAELFRVYVKDDAIAPAVLCPGVIPGLAMLKEKNLKLAIVTSKVKANVVQGLIDFDILQYFDVVVTPADTHEHKPHPAPALKALELLGVMPEQALMVGDSPYDIICGNEAGCQTAGVTYTAYNPQVLLDVNPNFMIDSVMQLAEHFSK